MFENPNSVNSETPAPYVPLIPRKHTTFCGGSSSKSLDSFLRIFGVGPKSKHIVHGLLDYSFAVGLNWISIGYSWFLM